MKQNHDLRFAFRLCRDLGIDDPIAWFNAVPDSVFRSWIAFYVLENEDTPGGKMQSPEQAAKTMQKRLSL